MIVSHLTDESFYSTNTSGDRAMRYDDEVLNICGRTEMRSATYFMRIFLKLLVELLIGGIRRY